MKFKGSIVKKKRQEQGHKQYYFALLTGISQAQLSKIENEKAEPSLSELIMISKVLGKKIEVFFERPY
jgi:transcriptional regulator with XRE-family HTH domain